MNEINALLERYKDDSTVTAIIRALGVMVLTPGIREHLRTTDPNALAQAEIALEQTPITVSGRGILQAYNAARANGYETRHAGEGQICLVKKPQ